MPFSATLLSTERGVSPLRSAVCVSGSSSASATLMLRRSASAASTDARSARRAATTATGRRRWWRCPLPPRTCRRRKPAGAAPVTRSAAAVARRRCAGWCERRALLLVAGIRARRDSVCTRGVSTRRGRRRSLVTRLIFRGWVNKVRALGRVFSNYFEIHCCYGGWEGSDIQPPPRARAPTPPSD